MNKQQFISMAFFTALETYFFNESLMAGNYFFASFFAYLLIRNFYTCYLIGKIAREIDKQINKE